MNNKMNFCCILLIAQLLLSGCGMEENYTIIKSTNDSLSMSSISFDNSDLKKIIKINNDFIFTSIFNRSYNTKDVLNIDDLIIIAKNNIRVKSKEQDCENFLSYCDFNFNKFLPVKGDIDSSSFYNVFYNKKNEICKISYHTIGIRNIEYEVINVHDGNYIFLRPEFYFENSLHDNSNIDERTKNLGFIILDRINLKSYYMASSIHDIPFFNIRGINSIMILNDSTLYPMVNLRMQTVEVPVLSELFYKGYKVKYENTIELESFKLRGDMKLSELTSFLQIELKKPCVKQVPTFNSELEELPFWYWHGNY